MININNYENIVIYQYGKCGSSSLRDLFKQMDKNVIHTHSPKNIPDHYGRDLIITVTRNLFDRNISDYFQNISRKDHFWYLDTEKNIQEKCTMGQILKKYNDKIKGLIVNSLYPWYDRFKRKTSVNIFKSPFDYEKKYLIYESEQNTVVVLRYEDIKNWDEIFTEIFSTSLPKLPKVNITKNKKIYKKFVEFKKKYVLTEDIIKTTLKMNVMQHFYTNNEIRGFIQKYRISENTEIPTKESVLKQNIPQAIPAIPTKPKIVFYMNNYTNKAPIILNSNSVGNNYIKNNNINNQYQYQNRIYDWNNTNNFNNFNIIDFEPKKKIFIE